MKSVILHRSNTSIISHSKKPRTFPSPHGSVGPCPTAVRHDQLQPGIVYCDYQYGDGDHYDNEHCDYQYESDYKYGDADQPDNLS